MDDPPPTTPLEAMVRENAAMRAENIALRERCLALAEIERRAAGDRALLAEILGSRAWSIVTRVRRLLSPLRLPRRPAGPTPAAVHFRHETDTVPRTAAIARRWKVSAIVPNYNHAAFLEERLHSIFAQTYPPHEILFLDDASTDDSLAIARRMASQSPVPFRILTRQTNSGSTFRQWLRGIDEAAGDLVWMAESDDSCRPDLLERLVPCFDDPGVMLAYGQSARIGPDGALIAPDYLDATDDLSPVQWRHPYCVDGREEIERALSQRNTLPNASAVVFRRPASIPERHELETLRLTGDWLFYCMRIRDGKIAYRPEPINGHRQHDQTVRSGFEHSIALFEEQWRVKARIFEAFEISAPVIATSVARGFAELAQRLPELLSHDCWDEHPRLAPPLDRLRSLLEARVGATREDRVLFLLPGVRDDRKTRAVLAQAGEAARRGLVFLANTKPGIFDPSVVAPLDRRIILIEGTLGIVPWAGEDDRRRLAVLRALMRFHRIGAIQADEPSTQAVSAAIAGHGFTTRPNHAGCFNRRHAERTVRATLRTGGGA